MLVVAALASAYVLPSLHQATPALTATMKASEKVFIEGPNGEPLLIKPPKKAAKGAKAGTKSKGFGAPSSPPSSSPTWSKLRSWIEGRGGMVAAIDVADVAPGLRGVVALSDLKKGDVVFSIPKKCYLDEGRADGSAVAVLWQQGGIDVPAYVRVALLLLWMQRTDRESKTWAPYLDMLPTLEDFETEGGPMPLWETSEVDETQCAMLAGQAARQRDLIGDLYASIVSERWAEHMEERASCG